MFGIRGLMKYFLGAEDAERDTKELAPLINYVNYPALYDGPKPEMDNIEMGYGKMTSGLLTVQGKPSGNELMLLLSEEWQDHI